MINLSEQPLVFQVGDRVRLNDSPNIPETTGTVIALGETKAPSVRVVWDNGSPPEWWNNIALELVAKQSRKGSIVPAGSTVRVVNVRSLSYGRVGMVTHRSRLKTTIRFSDVPRLSPNQLEDPTGLVATFKHCELEVVDGLSGPQVDLKDLAQLLVQLCMDAEMALNGEWDRSDDAFICQIDNISSFYEKTFGTAITEHPSYSAHDET